jgi:hypothetical protein
MNVLMTYFYGGEFDTSSATRPSSCLEQSWKRVVATRCDQRPRARCPRRGTASVWRLDATAGEALGRVCKPEVTGSIPVRSTGRKPRKRGAFCSSGSITRAMKQAVFGTDNSAGRPVPAATGVRSAPPPRGRAGEIRLFPCALALVCYRIAFGVRLFILSMRKVPIADDGVTQLAWMLAAQRCGVGLVSKSSAVVRNCVWPPSIVW